MVKENVEETNDGKSCAFYVPWVRCIPFTDRYRENLHQCKSECNGTKINIQCNDWPLLVPYCQASSSITQYIVEKWTKQNTNSKPHH